MKKKIRNNKNPINKIVVLRIVAVCIILAVVTLFFFLLQHFFTIKHIKCQLITGEACAPELSDSLLSLNGSSMFFEDYSEKLKNSQTHSQPVSLVNFKKRLPDTIVVLFQQEAAVYTIHHQDQTIIVSKSGRIFTHQMDITGLLPVDIAGEFIATDGFIDPTIHQILVNIISISSQLQLPVTKITWLDKSTIKLSMENRTEMFIIDSERPTLELNRLAVVLKSSEYRNIQEPKQELDLRFTMPVLRTQL